MPRDKETQNTVPSQPANGRKTRKPVTFVQFILSVFCLCIAVIVCRTSKDLVGFLLFVPACFLLFAVPVVISRRFVQPNDAGCHGATVDPNKLDH